jgi:hypothetical protein
MPKQLTTIVNKAQVTMLCADAISELERAARMYPKWPSELTKANPESIQAELMVMRAYNSGNKITPVTIFGEEFFEFLEAACKPDNQIGSRIELVQSLAMLLRIGCHLTDYVKASGAEQQTAQLTFVAPPVSTRAKPETVPLEDFDRAMAALYMLWSSTGKLREEVALAGLSTPMGKLISESLARHALYMKKAESLLMAEREKEVRRNRVCPVDEEKCDCCAGVTDEPCRDAKATYTDETTLDKCFYELAEGDCFNPESAFVGQRCPGCHRYTKTDPTREVEEQPCPDAPANGKPSPLNNETLRNAMRNVVLAFDNLSLESKGEACIHGVACLLHNLNQKEEVQLAAVDEAHKGIGAPGDWGYHTEQGTTWYQLLILCGEIKKSRKAVQP